MDTETSRCLKLPYDVALAVNYFVLGAETILAAAAPQEVHQTNATKCDCITVLIFGLPRVRP